MDHETMRHVADSWGLLLLVVTFVTAVGWVFRPGSRAGQDEARMIPFRDEDVDAGEERSRR